MKALIFIAIIAMGQIFMSCQKDDELFSEDLELLEEGQSGDPLNEKELSNLYLMREEEKLARDVYTTLYAKWNIMVFKNIASSEQVHMDSILFLIDKYELTDPVESNEIGRFTDEKLKELYDQLVTLGSNSLLEAFIVGATIEDLDIFDLDEAVMDSDNEDINAVYEVLNRGSRNHMRAFYAQINSQGGNYEAQFITQEKLDSIISSDWETGVN